MTISKFPIDIQHGTDSFDITIMRDKRSNNKKFVTGITLQSQKLQDPVCEPCLAESCMQNPSSIQ